MLARGLARSVASVGVALALLGAALGPASAANDGGSCCQDLEERVAELEATVAQKGVKEKTELKISGAVSRAILFWDDGTERNAYNVNNIKDGTTFSLEGETEFVKGWKAGFKLGVDTPFPSSDLADQFVDSAGPVTDLADAHFFISSERLGTVRAGLNGSGTDKVDSVNLAAADVLADSGPQDWNASFFLRAKDGTLLDVRWDNFFSPKIGATANLVTYISPRMMGFDFGLSWGKDDFWDAGLRYRETWHEVLEVAAGIGYHRDTAEGHSATVFNPLTDTLIGDTPHREDIHWGGGVAVRHKPSGLNIAVDYTSERHTDDCTVLADVLGAGSSTVIGHQMVRDAGEVSGKCRGPDEMVYIVGGIIQDIFPALGPTSFYGEYLRADREWNESHEEKLRAFTSDPRIFDSAGANFIPKLELKETVVTVWGFGVVQTKAAPKEAAAAAEPVIEVYLGYKHFEIDADPIGRSSLGALIDVPTKKLSDFEAVLTGATIRF
jgi:hypothetical protein